MAWIMQLTSMHTGPWDRVLSGGGGSRSRRRPVERRHQLCALISATQCITLLDDERERLDFSLFCAFAMGCSPARHMDNLTVVEEVTRELWTRMTFLGLHRPKAGALSPFEENGRC